MTILETAIRKHTKPVEGQYPRPWMTDMVQPEKARVFLVGYNQATPYPVSIVDSHDAYIDALFNRNGMSCRKLYDEMRRDKGPSPTRNNTDKFIKWLNVLGIYDVVETNVICHSSAMGSDLTRVGKVSGKVLFSEIINVIRPPILIVHGSNARKELSKAFVVPIQNAPLSETEGISQSKIKVRIKDTDYLATVFAIPSLAPPAWNTWCRWAPSYLKQLCVQVTKTIE